MSKLREFANKVISKLNPDEFMNDYQEWHAFWEGIAEGFCPWESRFEPTEELRKDIEGEHHYYVFGMIIGFAALIFSIAGAVRIILQVAF